MQDHYFVMLSSLTEVRRCFGRPYSLPHRNVVEVVLDHTASNYTVTTAKIKERRREQILMPLLSIMLRYNERYKLSYFLSLRCLTQIPPMPIESSSWVHFPNSGSLPGLLVARIHAKFHNTTLFPSFSFVRRLPWIPPDTSAPVACNHCATVGSGKEWTLMVCAEIGRLLPHPIQGVPDGKVSILGGHT